MSIHEVKCPECGGTASEHLNDGVIETVKCDDEACGYHWHIPVENQGDDTEAWGQYPEGWSCIECGEAYGGILPAVIDGGTVCEKCNKPKED